MRLAFAALVFAACSSPPVAQEPVAAPAPPSSAPPVPTDHPHDAPHGGIVQSVGDMHVEALMMASGVLFYLSDAQQKPITVEGYTGNAVIKGPAGVTTVDLMPMGDHLHAAATLAQGQPASAVLTLNHDGKALSASFATESVGMHSHDHTALHGGRVGMWGDYHLEYAPKDGEYRVWVTDEHRNPVAGTVTASLKDGDRTVPLTADATGALVGKGEGAGSRPVMIDVAANGTSFSLAFEAVSAQGH
jgi:hypothetical protein